MTDQPEWKSVAAGALDNLAEAAKWRFADDDYAQEPDQPETITVPVEVLRRLHVEATRHAFSHGQGWMVDPFGVHYWPTFLARVREQAQ